jgi:hypothetical protein
MSAACGATCGVTRERERLRERARALCLQPYSDPEPFAPEEPERLARSLSEALPCRVVVLAPGVEGPSWWLHLVATVGGSSWLECREGLGFRWPRGPQTSLRVGLSHHARFATLQEVRWLGKRDRAGGWVEARHLIGVEDRRLQAFVKATQGLLRRAKISTLDAAFLLERVAPSEPRTLWEVLFDPQPPDSTVGVYLPRSATASRACG